MFENENQQNQELTADERQRIANDSFKKGQEVANQKLSEQEQTLERQRLNIEINEQFGQEIIGKNRFINEFYKDLKGLSGDKLTQKINDIRTNIDNDGKKMYFQINPTNINQNANINNVNAPKEETAEDLAKE